MRRAAIVAAGAVALAGMLFAIDVAEDEVRGAAAVEFINYDGPRELLFDADEVRDIGRVLAAGLARGATTTGYGRKYTLVHAFDPAMPERLGADILTLEPAAQADHINTVRYILAGFLEAGYGYSAGDAALLAVFVTYYNAVHRGDIPYFSGAYQPRVLQNITSANAGLARRYDQWAGASRILVPLTERAARRVPGALDTSALTDSRVVEELRKRDDRGVDERKDMIGLKERETAQAESETAATRAEVERQKAALAAEQKALDEKARSAADAERALEAERRRAQATSDATEAARRQQEVARREAGARAGKGRAGRTAEDHRRAEGGNGAAGSGGRNAGGEGRGEKGRDRPRSGRGQAGRAHRRGPGEP